MQGYSQVHVWRNHFRDDSKTLGQKGKYTLDELRVDLKENLRAKRFALSANGDKTSNWVKKRGMECLLPFNTQLLTIVTRTKLVRHYTVPHTVSDKDIASLRRRLPFIRTNKRIVCCDRSYQVCQICHVGLHRGKYSGSNIFTRHPDGKIES